MKKLLLSLAATVVLTLPLASCNSNSPKASADKFMTGLLHYDYEAAKSVSTEETKKMIDLMAQFSAMMPDSMKQAAKKVKVNIKDSKEEGDKATVTYTTSEDPTEKKMNLVKQNGKWLVQYSKMDEGQGADPAAETDIPAEEPVNDTATAPPADGTAVDTTHR
jgi:hypothetical protein